MRDIARLSEKDKKALFHNTDAKMGIFTENNITDIETKLPKIQSENTGGNISDL